jgi:hypothetical protein
MKYLLVGVTALLLAGTALAQQGTPYERRVCKQDYLKYCGHLEGMQAGTCLQHYRKKLHKACAGVLRSHGM